MMTMDVHTVLPSPVFKPNIFESNGKLDPRIQIKPYLNGYKQPQQQQPIPQTQHISGFSLNPACACLLMFGSLVRFSWIALRTVLVTINNLYCIPSYAVWMILLLPIRAVKPTFYWRVEGRLFHWLLSMVSLWSYSAGYHIMESGDKIDEVVEIETLVLVNHQSTSDVPLLMAAFNTRPGLLPNLTWVMDRIFKFTNFGIVSTIHGDFFVVAGKAARNQTILELSKYLQSVFIPRGRKWIVLFPEGGFLHKRRAISQRFAEKNNLPYLQHVTVPRMGAVQAIVDGLGPRSTSIATEDVSRSSPPLPVTLKYILDITLAYPNGEPLDIIAIISSYIRPCNIHLHYRLFPIQRIPTDAVSFQNWLFKIYEEKEKMLASYYETGIWTINYDRETIVKENDSGFVSEPVKVEQDLIRMVMIHSFFILSTLFQWTLIKHLYSQFMISFY